MSQAREMIDRLRLASHVDLLGERRDVSEILSQSSMFVMSSRTEGISLTLLEAMACGLPVVATDVGGNGEVVAQGETGWLVPPGDPERLAEAILSTWRERKAAKRFGRAARERVEQKFDVVQMVRQYEQMYEEVLAESETVQVRAKEFAGC
jgi:glycosyltransferase involved in cell wall biosynthesis